MFPGERDARIRFEQPTRAVLRFSSKTPFLSFLKLKRLNSQANFSPSISRLGLLFLPNSVRCCVSVKQLCESSMVLG